MGSAEKQTRSDIKRFMLDASVEYGTVLNVIPSIYCKSDTIYLIRSYGPHFMCTVEDVKEANEILEEVRRIVDSPLYKVLNEKR